MLPKVATHILHTTSRAAAAVHNQTSTLRNVFQLQTSPGSSAGSGTTPLGPWNGTGNSSKGSHGPGPGGAKQNTGSRFYTGFTGPVRAVTQANAVTSQDGTLVQHEDSQEDTAPVSSRRAALRAPKEAHLRSSSVSIGAMGHHKRAESLSVLKTVQIHARSRQAFAQPPSAIENTAPSKKSTLQSSRPLIARRNSTSSPTSVTVPLPSTSNRRNSTYAAACDVDPSSIPPPHVPTSNESGSPQTTQPPTPEFSDPKETAAYLALKAARDSQSPVAVADAVHHFRQTTEKPTVREFNMALGALVSTRRAGEPLTLLMETYNDMIKFSLIPTIQTYALLVQALTDRDFEVQQVIRTIQTRIQRRTSITGRFEPGSQSKDEEGLAMLQEEDSLASALALFENIISFKGNSHLPAEAYHTLLRGCACRGNAAQASRIFAQLESRKDIKPTSMTYKYLIQAYTNAGEIKGAERVFTEYHEICRSRPERLFWGLQGTTYDQRRVLMLVEVMISSPSTGSWSSPSSGMDVPQPASPTFTAVLAGFCDSGDVETASVWFNRLLEQQHSPGDDPLAQGQVVRPDTVAWNVMIESLASHGMVDSLNNAFEQMLTIGAKDGISPTVTQKVITFAANMKRMQSLASSDAELKLKFLLDKVMVINDDVGKRSVMVQAIWEESLSHGLVDLGAKAILDYAETLVNLVRQGATTSVVPALRIANEHLVTFLARLYETTKGNVPFALVLSLSRLARNIKHEPPFADEHVPYVLHSYGLARRAGAVPADMQPTEWTDLLNAAIQVEVAEIDGRQEIFPPVSQSAFGGVVSLIQDMEAAGLSLSNFDKEFVDRVLRVVFLKYDGDQIKAITAKLGPEFQVQPNQADAQSPASTLSVDEQTTNGSSQASSPTLYNSPAESFKPSPVADAPATTKIFVDARLSREIDELLKSSRPVKEVTGEAYTILTDTLLRGRLPTPVTVGRLIQALGRAGEIDKVQEVYGIAQNALNVGPKYWSSEAWFKIEDGMVIALAHAGQIDAAHAHRERILAHGGAPTADAYGVLIQNMKDTTDDASNALALFQEAVARKVWLNQYLYNNIISKLAKARKAEQAVDLFHQMKAQNINPSSITYGAVIGACTRVGDVQSAETLFAEMEAARNFKPRVPPYNTMMQLYTTTKPNRERALYYYEKMKQARVKPTAHTYKLLMDAYGALEPVDINSMEQVFLSLQRDTSLPILGIHFASLINAHGCVVKDLTKVRSIFDSISSYHPRAQAPDAVVYEAMINVLVAHRRADLIEGYVTKMKEQGVRMTAYIANFLIKGYANAHQLEQARATFESLVDPPEGIAAPGNHIPHDGVVADRSRTGAALEAVYREPSTWEAMVRAELGAGEKARALELLERLKTRKYPEAVFNRISGILVDHSMVL
ncbi:hypothetical protein M378DRAFT_168036 [Amanita muscaria Koide BX008]|uniref:PROP1-like PPR domain-containing protein n=1 Tax=Amanita muscaria (strain Koide BX008) TaxID=946122 RepID=A0A0C2WGJ8_AMAMK|nr:hypothetical protein M378DRAFT_168036 [Amanita muscaria Koide BX008]